MGEDAGLEQGWAIADSLSDAIVLLDADGRIEATNAAWLQSRAASTASPGKTSGKSKSEKGREKIRDKNAAFKRPGIGRLYLSVCRSPDKTAFSYLPKVSEVEAGLRSVLEGRSARYTCEYTKRRGNSVVWYNLVITKRAGGVKGATVAHSEVTGLFTESQTLFGTLLEGTADAVCLCDTNGRLLIANPALARCLGKEVREIVGRKGEEIATGEMQRLILGENPETLRSGKMRYFEITAATPDGVRTFSVTKGVYSGMGIGGRGVFCIARDITELRAMQREIIEISDKEKQRLGQELHENLCQYLVGISLLGNVLYEDLLRLKLKQGEDARQITSLVKDAISEVRALVKGLAPIPEEHQEELITALVELAEHARAIGKIRCCLRVPRTAQFVDPSIAIHLYRIAQEAVHNAIKHSGAKRLEIILSNRRNAVELTVKDDGVGLEKPPNTLGNSNSGYGLYIMNYRSRAIGATLEFRRPPKGGTAVVCTVPLPKVSNTGGQG